MKNVKLWGGLVVVVSLLIGFVMAVQMGEKSPVFVAGSLVLDEALVGQAQRIDTLYIIVYDADSPMPMPYGAMRRSLREPATAGKFYDFFITKEHLQLMNENLPPPQYMRIKARLDLDGIAGMDQPGDLTGEVARVAFGTTGITITIDHHVSGM